MYSKRLCLFDPFFRKRDEFFTFVVPLTIMEEGTPHVSRTPSLRFDWSYMSKIPSTLLQM